MGDRFAFRAKVKNRGVPGYERGFWLLVVASSLMVVMLLMIESSRARPLGLGLGKRVEVEQLPSEALRDLELNN